MLLLALLPAAAAWVSSPEAEAAALEKRSLPSFTPPVYTLDLDEPASTRWNHIAKDYKRMAPKIIDYFEEVVPKWAVPLIEAVGAAVQPYFHEYGDEMVSVADTMGLPKGAIVLLNLIMQIEELGINCSNWNNTGPTVPDDPGCKLVNPSQSWCYCHDAHKAGAIRKSDGVAPIFTRRTPKEDAADVSGGSFGSGMCTSVVAQAPDGSIVHARNLDWNLPVALREIVIDIDFMKGGKKIFRGTGGAGISGLINGITYPTNGTNTDKVWTVSIDARGKGGKILDNFLQALLVHSMTPSQHLRKALEDHATDGFDAAVTALTKTPQIDENYFILAGANAGEGAVVTRGREKAEDVWKIDTTKPTGWYRLQTNYDHWDVPPVADDRRHPGYALMAKMGKAHVSPEAMWGEVITKFPLFNGHTDYTMIAVPKTGLYNSTVWMGGEH